MGHPMQFLDVGGGLGVDYDGSRTAFDSSMNYTLQEYARDVVYNISDVCESEKVPHPTIVSESGRAIVAHHSILVVEAFSSIEKGSENHPLEIKETDPKLLSEMIETQKALTKLNRMEVLHDAMQIKEQCQSMFELGLLDLESKAKIETIYWQIAQSVVELCRGMRYVPDEIKELEIASGDQYLCNFSVFQSLLDHWALGQLFPIMPIHHLDQPPDRNGTLADITCDSDGKVSKFVDLQDVKETLPLHRIRTGEPYYLGFFLMGAYQDIMGDLHNLFGRVTEVHVFLDEDEDSGWYIEEVIEGSTIGSVLSMTQWDQNELVRLVKSQVDAAIKSDRLKPNEAMRLFNEYERGLRGYTYLNFQNGLR
jgi:arginine decarboxylase